MGCHQSISRSGGSDLHPPSRNLQALRSGRSDRTPRHGSCGDCPSHQPPEDVSHDDLPHPSIWLARSCQAPQPDGLQDFTRNLLHFQETGNLGEEIRDNFALQHKRWSDVMPNGPAAASSEANWKGSASCASATALSISSLRTGGRLSGSVNALRVAIVPGAIDAPSRACLAADNSPLARGTKHGGPLRVVDMVLMVLPTFWGVFNFFF